MTRRKQPVTPILQEAIKALDTHIEPIKVAGPERIVELLSHSRQVEYTFPVAETTKQVRAIQVDIQHIVNRVKDAGL
jgi:hypothetical protein